MTAMEHGRIRDEALEEAAAWCDKLAEMREAGAGDSPPGHRLRQAARYIRALKFFHVFPPKPSLKP